ncbi:MAG: hypothetical protein ACK559_05720, partial [bacterium]
MRCDQRPRGRAGGLAPIGCERALVGAGDRWWLQVVRADQDHETSGETAGAGVWPLVSQKSPQAEREFTVYFFDTDAGGVVHN